MVCMLSASASKQIFIIYKTLILTQELANKYVKLNI
jgi:hypothetical protein